MFNITLTDLAGNESVVVKSTMSVVASTFAISDAQVYEGVSGTLSFAAGETSKWITVTVNGDTRPEPNQQVKVDIATQPGSAGAVTPELNVYDDWGVQGGLRCKRAGARDLA